MRNIPKKDERGADDLHENDVDDELTLSGCVEDVLFRNENNGYTVFEMSTDDELVTVVGELGIIDEGELVLVKGKYIVHARFGKQFHAIYCERKMPSSAASIEKYLSGRSIKGIGPRLAHRIVEEFGEKTLEIMENEPQRLTAVKGISAEKCNAIAAEYKQIFGVRMLLAFFSLYGLQASFAMKAYRLWGNTARDMVTENPFRLCASEIGLPFRKAEELAESFEFEDSEQKRIRAGLIYILEANLSEGHTCLPVDRYIELAKNYLEAREQDVYDAYNYQLGERNIIEYERSGRSFAYLVDYFNAEQYIAGRIGVLSAFMPISNDDFTAMIDDEEKRSGIEYDPIQREGITLALTKGLVILTGGPGTGKTTTLNAIISIYEKLEKRVLLAAPTGRAAKRMSELTGRDAKTIHRLLEVGYTETGELVFKHNEENTLSCEVIVIDEMSMIDTLLFESLLRALKHGCRILMVGDSDQLPSVGAGNVLRDLIDSRRIRTIHLKKIFRQAQQSLIITNAHRIVNGEFPDILTKSSDFFFFERVDNDAASKLVIDLCAKRLPKAYGYSSYDDIQVLSPAKKGAIGTIELNKALQAVLNPPCPLRGEVKTPLYTLRQGDKVMQIKNNYDIVWSRTGENGAGIFNGDIGRIVGINRHSAEATIDFDGRTAVYPFAMLEQVELAYAVTVHKSQGSEFNAVILSIMGVNRNLSFRNLLYTAVTRAKKLLIVIGTREQLEQMVTNNKKTLRYTCLRAMLEAEIAKQPSEIS